MLANGAPRRLSPRSGGAAQKGVVALPRARQQPDRVTALPPVTGGAHHLTPLDRAVATVAAPHSPVRAETSSLPVALTPSVAPTSRQLVSGSAVGGAARMWPAVVSTRQQQRRSRTALESKAPLALQLEAFIRREHQQYLREHPACSRTDCLHIFREVLSTFVNHFSEYRGVLSVVRDEYDAALNEMAEKVKQMQVEYLESQSDRELHAMELIQLKESLNATISNQKAQLSATQELVHSMRDQLSAAEHANSLLTLEMEQRRKTYLEAQQQVKLLSHAMIEESGRTAAAREASRKLEKENQLHEARIKVLKENVAELEDFLRQQTYAQLEEQRLSDGDGVAGVPPHPAPSAVAARPLRQNADSSSPGVYSKRFVAQLLARVDVLEMKLANAASPSGSGGTAAAVEVPPQEDRRHPSRTLSPAPNTTTPPHRSIATVGVADATLPVMREWLRREGVGEAELEASDIIVPPGRCATEVMGFLAVTQPVRHRHLSLAVTLQLLETMWDARALSPDSPRLPQFFLEWLRTQSGDPAEAKALGVNILDTCQRNCHHPECHGLLAVLKGFLPEDVVHEGRRRLNRLRRSASKAPATQHGKMAFDAFFAEVRAACPEKSVANMLHLRFTVFRRSGADGQVELAELLHDDAYFVLLFKQQWLQEVDAFTLRVVEGIRDEGDSKRNLVAVAKATRVLRDLDAALSEEEVYTYISQASLRPIIDVSSAADGLMTPLEAMLTRFRTTVLLYRRSPEDVIAA